ncbi:MAG: TIGR00730 family Rossman fold protein, partial [Streptosporangiaceae bacterium]
MDDHPIPGRAPLAYQNERFLNSADARSLRLVAEYLEPLGRLRRENIQDTIVFFGSARILSAEAAQAQLGDLAANGDAPRAAERALELARYYEDARELARLLTLWADALPSRRRRFVVTSGGGPGIMEAANRGACEAGGKTIGFNIRLPFEQVANPYISPTLNFEFHYFFMRKFWFAYPAKALVAFPGGFGTLDEMMEMLTLVQTQKLSKKIVVVLYGSSYWKQIINFQALADWGTISPSDLELFHFADSPHDAFQI